MTITGKTILLLVLASASSFTPLPDVSTVFDPLGDSGSNEISLADSCAGEQDKFDALNWVRNRIVNLAGEVEQAQVYALNGTLVKSAFHTSKVDVSDLALGVYIVKTDMGQTRVLIK